MPAFLSFTGSAHAVLYSETCNDGQAASRWVTNATGTTTSADFAFDYSTLGIAAAPGGTGTTGLKLDASSSASGIVPGIIALPVGGNFSGDYRLTFSMYSAFTTGNTTEFSYFGINHTSTAITAPTAGSATVAAAGLSSNGFDFAVDADSGSSKDIRAYANGAEFQGTASGGGYTGTAGAGTALGMESSQEPYTNIAPNGVFGNAWRTIQIDQVGTLLTWSMDGQLLAGRTVVPGSGNILLGYMDVFSGQPSAADTFVIYDNVMVDAIPEPSSMVLFGLAGMPFLSRRRNKV